MKHLLLLFFGLILFLALVSLIYLDFQSLPFSSDTTIKDFSVNQGDGIVSISRRLEKNKLIRSYYVFIFYALRTGLNTKLQAGDFRLSPSLSTPEIVVKLSRGGSTDYWLKILDGMRREEVARLLEGNILPLAEGHFFPDSYAIPSHYPPDQIASLIETHFQQEFTRAKLEATTILSDQSVLILASLLEREARTLESKQTISGILHNRLNINMALQVDATVQYVRDSKIKNIKTYWEPITKTDLIIVSPYNTYRQPGLPPAPICNPGFNSLYAAFHPTPSDYLYYLTGTDGLMYYAKTLTEHNTNIAIYLK